MNLNDLLALTGALGGFKAIEWVVTFLVNRRTNARKEEASVNSLEDENERKQVNWLEERLAQRDSKIDTIYVELRQSQQAHMEEVHKRHELELKLKESEARRCDVRGCGGRIPPSDF